MSTEENKALAQLWIEEAWNKGPLMGIAATGKQGIITGIDIYCIADGKIEEAWSNWDTLGMLQEMGVIPSMG